MATQPRRAARQRPALRLVSRRRPQRSALVPAAVVVLLAVFGVAALQAYVGQEGLRVARLERELREAEERFALLRQELAERSSPDRLSEAASELGLVPAGEPTFLPAPGVPADDAERDASRALETKQLLARP